jgi:outer membrane lipoprotein-sorting protein
MMKKLTGILFLLIFLSGCIVTASSGTRTEYEDKMKQIDKDYREKKITKEEYIQLKNQASKQGEVGREDGSTGFDQRYP